MKSYFISDPSYYRDSETFKIYLQKVFSNHTVDYACFRDKVSSDIVPYAKIFLQYTKRYNVPCTLINTDISLAKALGFDGIHLTSSQFDLIGAAREKNLFVIISTHTSEEVVKAQIAGADAITISPIFVSPHKGRPKGIAFLKKIVKSTSLKVFALGGIISKEQIVAIKESKAYGFASIRYFIY